MDQKQILYQQKFNSKWQQAVEILQSVLSVALATLSVCHPIDLSKWLEVILLNRVGGKER